MAELEKNMKTDISMRYVSVRHLSKTKGLPYDKVLHALRIGVRSSNVRIVNMICDAADINLAELAEGNIVRKKKKTIEELNYEFGNLYINLNEEGQDKANKHLKYLLLKYNKNKEV